MRKKYYMQKGSRIDSRINSIPLSSMRYKFSKSGVLEIYGLPWPDTTNLVKVPSIFDFMVDYNRLKSIIQVREPTKGGNADEQS